MSKRILHLLTLILGLLGLVGCIAVIVGTWNVDVRVNRTTESIFDKIDSALGLVTNLVTQAQECVQAAKFTTESIETSLNQWTKREARERLASQFEVEEKAGRLSAALNRTDHWLELSESSVQLVQQGLELTHSSGAPVETTPADRLLEDLAAMRVELAGAIKSAQSLKERVAEAGDEKALTEKLNQTVRLALRLLATLSSIESRLGDFQSSLTETQARAQDLETKTLGWVRIVTIRVTLLIGWMAAGQAALCSLGWRGLRHTRSKQPTERVAGND